MSQNVSAQQAYFDWGNDMDLFIGYNEQTDMIEAVAAIASATNQNDQFSLGLYVDGREYRKFFKYSSTTKYLAVSFEIPQDLRDETSIYISIKDAQYNEVYTTIPTGYSVNSTPRNDQASVVSSFGSSSIQKDYGVFSMWASTSSKAIISRFGSDNQKIETSRQNVSDLTRAELLNRVSTGDFEQAEIPEIITSLEKYGIITPQNQTPQAQPETVTPSHNTQSYTPKYSSQNAEPSSINGIGNSPTRSSWRAGQ